MKNNQSGLYVSGFGKRRFFTMLIIGFLAIIAGGFYLEVPAGSGLFGMGLATCLWLLEWRLNSIGVNR